MKVLGYTLARLSYHRNPHMTILLSFSLETKSNLSGLYSLKCNFLMAYPEANAVCDPECTPDCAVLRNTLGTPHVQALVAPHCSSRNSPVVSLSLPYPDTVGPLPDFCSAVGAACICVLRDIFVNLALSSGCDPLEDGDQAQPLFYNPGSKTLGKRRRFAECVNT